MQNIFHKLKIDQRIAMIILALLVICTLFAVVTDGLFINPKNIANLTRQSAIVGLLATGMVFVIVSGNIDLSVGSQVGLVGGLSAIIATQFLQSLPVTILLTLIIGLIIGSIQGLMIAYLRVPAFIITLGGMMIFRGLIKGITNGETITVNESYQFLGSGYTSELTGWIIALVVSSIMLFIAFQKYRSNLKEQLNAESLASMLIRSSIVIVLLCSFIFVFTLNDIPFVANPADNDISIPIPVLILGVLAVVCAVVANKTIFGRRVYAIGGNSEAAFLSGINVKKNTLWVFMLMGVMSAVAAIVYTARVGSAAPDAGRNLELDAIAACVIGGTSLTGGKGTIAGAIIGALIMASLDNGMSILNIEHFYQDIIKGLVLVIAVYADIAGKKGR